MVMTQFACPCLRSLELCQYVFIAAFMWCCNMNTVAVAIAVAVLLLTDEVLAACTRLRRWGRFAAQLAVPTVYGSSDGLIDRFLFVDLLSCVPLLFAGAVGINLRVAHVANVAVSSDGVTPVVAAVHPVVDARRAAGSSNSLSAVALSAMTIGVVATRDRVLCVVVFLHGGR